MPNAPVEILGWDETNSYWAAKRDGEPSFTGVQGLGDAYMACTARDADLIISDDVYAEMVAAGDAPPERPNWVHPPSSVE
ncbi:MAG TPA: hypothetical protein VGJ38_10715 [Jatrophihabitantaceae bacterium]|jgi:hypothetical protein